MLSAWKLINQLLGTYGIFLFIWSVWDRHMLRKSALRLISTMESAKATVDDLFAKAIDSINKANAAVSCSCNHPIPRRIEGSRLLIGACCGKLVTQEQLAKVTSQHEPPGDPLCH